MSTDDPVQLRDFAKDAANGAVALVEAEAMTAYQPGRGERMVVRRTIAGTAPAQFMVERGPFPSSASCDDLYQVGQRKLLIFYRATAVSGAIPTVRTSGLCTNLLLDKPVFRDAVASRIAGSIRAGERG